MGLSVPGRGPAGRRPHSGRPANARPPAVVNLPRPPAVAADPLGRDAPLAALEAALMLADEPLAAKRLAEVTGAADATAARTLVGRLREALDRDAAAFTVVEVAGGYQLLTRPAYHPWLLRLRRTGHDARLTPPALETLAVIAHKQPIMRAEIEAIRGVGCGEMIRLLAERGLIRVGGRHDSLGRPQLYITTKKFLQLFGLNSLDDLPTVDALPGPKSR
jgi:segregation and condensation protein B